MLNDFDSNNREKNFDPKFVEEKIIGLLRNKDSLNFSDICKELDIKNGEREILLDILQRMIIEKKIKKEKIQIVSEEGIIFTSKFSLL